MDCGKCNEQCKSHVALGMMQYQNNPFGIIFQRPLGHTYHYKIPSHGRQNWEQRVHFMLKCHVAEWLINLKYSPSYVYLDWNCIKIKLLTHVWRRIHSLERKKNLSEHHTLCNIKLGDQFQWDYTNLLILSLVKRPFWFQGYGLKYTFFEVLSSCFMWGAKYNVHQFM